MAQVSTEAYDFIFSRRELTEARIEKITGRLEKARQRFADLSDDPITFDQQRQLGRQESLINVRSARLASLQDDLIAYDAVLPEDSFGFSNFSKGVSKGGKETLSFTISVTDSPYDDTFVDGDTLRVSVTGDTKKGRAGASSIGVGAVSVSDDTISFTLGSVGWANLINDSEGDLTLLNGDNEVLYSVGYNNII